MNGVRRAKALVPALYILFLMLPIYWLVAMSFKTTNEILGGFTLWPHRFTLDNYAKIFSDRSWYMGYVNSLAYVPTSGCGHTASNTVIVIASGCA